jgi:hypothetical protein
MFAIIQILGMPFAEGLCNGRLFTSTLKRTLNFKKWSAAVARYSKDLGFVPTAVTNLKIKKVTKIQSV